MSSNHPFDPAPFAVEGRSNGAAFGEAAGPDEDQQNVFYTKLDIRPIQQPFLVPQPNAFIGFKSFSTSKMPFSTSLILS